MDTLEEQAATVPPNQEAPTRRNKVRKGTRSCWECKRRKIRCRFPSSEADTCIGCQRRRAPCVSQDLPEDLAPVKIGHRHLSERLSRVEGILCDLLAGNHSSAISRLPGEPRHLANGSPAQLVTATPRANEPAPPMLAEVCIRLLERCIEMKSLYQLLRVSVNLLPARPVLRQNRRFRQTNPISKQEPFITSLLPFQSKTMPELYSRRAPGPRFTRIWLTPSRMPS